MPQPLFRLFVSAPLHGEALISLEKPQTHYVVQVLRLSVKARILIFNGEAGEWLTEIVEARKNQCIVRCLEQTRAQTRPQDLHYCFAPLKHARLDYVVQKAVELGVSLLQPTQTAHTQVSRLNMERMQANIVEAAEQCGVLSLPEVREPIKLEALLKRWDTSRALIFCDESADSTSPLAILQKVEHTKLGVLIGPEGGFSQTERDLLRSHDFVVPISLGPRIMRADTAAVAALALVNAVLGDWR